MNKNHGPLGGETPEEWERTVDPYDETADLDARARVYLDINCASCHRESGAGGRASFQLMSWLSLEDTKIIGGKPMVGLTGDPDTCIVKAGAPDQSELLHRMKLDIPGMRMPLIGSSAIDEQGVALIEEWIRSLPEAAAIAE